MQTTNAPSQPRWVGRVVLGMLLAVVLYAGLGVLADVRDLRAALADFRGTAVLLALALVLGAYMIRALRWRLYLHRVGALRKRGADATADASSVLEPAGREALGFAAGFTMGVASGKVGQIVKAYYLQLATGLPYAVSIPATVAERMADLASVVLLLLIGLALSPSVDLRAPALILALLALFTIALRSDRLLRGLLRSARRWTWVARHEESVLTGHERLRAHTRLRDTWAPALVGLAAYGLEAIALQVLADGFGFTLAIGSCILVLALADLAGVVSLVPGGLGAAEAGLLVLLTLHGAPLATATGITILFRLCTLWFGVALGLLAAAALHWMHRDRSAQA